MQDQAVSINDLFNVFWRRRLQYLYVTGSLILVAIIVAVLVPSVYKSSATILIESQDIPSELIASTVTSYATERLQIISQRAMTTSNLSEIIKKYNLYPDKRKKLAVEEVISQMRDDIDFSTINAEVVDPRSGRTSTATIAFKLSYTNENPYSAQKVAKELSSLYLNENIRERTRKATQTSEFLTQEGIKLNKRIVVLENKLAKFKEKNVNNLPELINLNMQMKERTQRDLVEIQRQSRSLQQQKILLKDQLKLIDPYSNLVSTTGERILGTDDRLKSLQSNYASKEGVYLYEHPDLVRMRSEIIALKKEATRKREDTKTIKPDNPAYIHIKAQYVAADTDLLALKAQENTLQEKLSSYEARIYSAPQVEREYKSLSRDYDNALIKYKEIKDKELQAILAEELEKGSNGERFTMIDPPLVPEKPVQPGKKLIIFIGVFLSLISGIIFISIRESLDTALRGLKSIIQIKGSYPLVSIPYIDLPDDIEKRKKNSKLLCKRNIFVAVILMAGLIVTAFLIHFNYKPLDVLWFIILRKLNI